MRLGLSTELLLSELDSATDVLKVWVAHIQRGIPFVDTPLGEEELSNWLRAFRGEMLFVSDKCASLATRIVDAE